MTALFEQVTANHALIVKEPGVPGAMTRPGQRRDHHPVLGAVHPRRVSLQDRLHDTQIQAPPPPPTLPLVITRATLSAHPAAPPLPAHWPHMRDQQALVFIELDPLDRGLLDPEQPSPYPSIAHAVPHP